jgi:hypothetical protein
LQTLFSNMRRLEPSTTRWVLVLVLAVLFTTMVLTLDLSIAESAERSKAGDFFQFWAAGRALLQGSDPYDPLAWSRIYEQEGHWRWQTDQRVFLYPLWTAFLFAPLALLPVTAAFVVWTLVNEALLVVSVVLLTRALNWEGLNFWLLLTLATAIAFEPVSLTVLFGHLGLVLLGLTAGSLYLASRGRYAAAGVLLALTTMKPQLFLLVYAVLLAIMVFQRKWPFVAAFTITTAALFASSWLLVPHWIGAWQAYVAGSSTVRLSISPTIWGASHSVSVALHREDLWPLLGVAALATLIGILTWALLAPRRIMAGAGSLSTGLSLSMLASLLIAPYVLSYDFVLLLLPVSTCLWMAHRLAQPVRMTVVILLLVCTTALPWALLAVAMRTGQETSMVVVPLSLLAVLLAVSYGGNRTRELLPLPGRVSTQHLDGTSGGTTCPL